jgi:putative transposase
VKYSFIALHKKAWPIDVMCRFLGVKRNGYYGYQKTQSLKIEDPNHAEMLEWVKEIAESSRYSYGTRRMQKALNALCFPVTRGKAKKLMDEAGVKVRSRKTFKVTTNSDHKQPVFDNVLDREFDVNEQDMTYVQDITYIWTQEGWLYLAVVIDLFSRKIVGWSMGSRMKAQLVCDALNMAICQRKPRPGLIVHSDRGSQYASKVYRQLLKQYGIIGSMSRLGNCWDNAVAESFFGSLKQEMAQWCNYQTRHEAQQDILEYISMFYNAKRLHSYLDYKSPNEFEKEVTELRHVA